MAKVLLVEDDQGLATIVIETLRQQRCAVEHSADGDDAAARLACSEYDLIILDWNLPNKTGVEICSEFRNNGGTTPVLMLTGRGLTSERVEGLDAGADDYLTKPFNVEELAARVRALLRRVGGRVHGNVLKFDDISLDRDTFSVSRADKNIQLVPKEFAILEFLMRHPNTVFSGEALFKRVWTWDEEASGEIIRTHIKNLRKKLDIPGKECPIQTIHGVGYKLQTPDRSKNQA